MKVLCSLSGLEFTCQYLSYNLHSRESYHPVFDIPQKKLIPLVMRELNTMEAKEDTPSQAKVAEEPYLLFLALLASTGLVEFRVPAKITSATASIVASNMEALLKIVGTINIIKTPAFVLPKFCISPETATLDNVKFWIQAWQDNYQEFIEGYKSQSEYQEIIRREKLLETYILNHTKNISSYGVSLANWAALTGSFPKFQTPTIWGVMSIHDYWRKIIINLANRTNIISIPRKDIEELREHCIDNIPMGSLTSSKLVRLLNDSLNTQDNFYGSTDFAILLDEDNTSTEASNLQLMVKTAPTELPHPSNYPTKLSYLIAKSKWDLAQKHLQSLTPTQDAQVTDSELPTTSTTSTESEF